MSISNLFNHEQMMAISTLYNERHRHYHNLEHIHHCLAEYDTFFKDEKPSWNYAVELAIWFHDIVYNPRAQPGQNEADSATMFRSICHNEKNSQIGAKVKEMILATAAHESDDSQTQIMLDVDMSILGADKYLYGAYKSGIRLEYHFIPGTVYNAGRRSFLKKTLERPRIFLTDYFHTKYEETARKNIKGELDVLQCFGM